MHLSKNFNIYISKIDIYISIQCNTSTIWLQITKPEWKPDFGPAEFVASWGATMAGARKFLIAYNVNVLGKYFFKT